MTKRVIKWATISVVVLMVCHFPISFLFLRWSPYHCSHQEVDITTGKLRFTRYLFFCKFYERVENSPLSEAISPGTLPTRTPQWRRVNTFSPGVHYSPHYAFHGATGQIRFWSGAKLPDELKEKTALHILALWQQDDCDSLAGDYVDNLLHGLMDKNKRQELLTALPTLEMPLEETIDGQVVRTVFFPNGQPMQRSRGYMNASGDFARHGVWERWWPNGTRSSYGHFQDGQHHGRRFEWDQDGTLLEIEAFDQGQLSEFEFENLEQHPDYSIAEELAEQDEPEPGP